MKDAKDKSREIMYTYSIGEKVILRLYGEVIDRVMKGNQELVNIWKSDGGETGLIPVGAVKRIEERGAIEKRMEGMIERDTGFVPYVISDMKSPDNLGRVVEDLADVAVALAGEPFSLDEARMRELRVDVIRLALLVCGCADTWMMERRVWERERLKRG